MREKLDYILPWLWFAVWMIIVFNWDTVKQRYDEWILMFYVFAVIWVLLAIFIIIWFVKLAILPKKIKFLQEKVDNLEKMYWDDLRDDARNNEKNNNKIERLQEKIEKLEKQSKSKKAAQ